MRIINRSPQAGTVSIEAIDDSDRSVGPVDLSPDAMKAVQFNSRDLGRGNSGIGLPAGVGDGSHDWRLRLSSALDIEPLAYIRTTDGFLTNVHDVASEESPLRYRVSIFSPGSNRSLVSRPRLINPGSQGVQVTISGRDANGDPAPEGEVRLTLAGGAARTLSARQLEEGDAALSGRLGDGAGKWQLIVTSDAPIQVMGLMETRSGHLTNLSPRGAASGQRTIPLVLPDAVSNRQGFGRIVNRFGSVGSVRIEAIDDTGRVFGPVNLALDALQSVQFNSRDLERGNPAVGLSGGVGNGNWRLNLETTLDIKPLAYVRTSDGFLTGMQDVAASEGLSMP